ncbi:hypothetical protein D187_009745 [Cystobacter fuscus DSM 2262]|uniref:Uncharacterized protein n=2 Tax=Cystobacter fuscus TaxID=43 RepID=S9NVR4_CYSF2|nr:hypothetical protein D187_009745 [Cystobacter fuscus DSM 2262]
MSVTPAPFLTESRPSPWLTMAVTIVVSLLGLAVQWGTLGADLRNLERRATATEAELARVSSVQVTEATQLARLEALVEARFDGMAAELGRLARAVERLTDARSATARDSR